jgi:uncharacterized membrane protein
MVATDVIDLESAPAPISPRNLAKCFEPEEASKCDRGDPFTAMQDMPNPEPQSRLLNLTKLISPEDVVTPLDMTGWPCGAPKSKDPTEIYNSPQHLRASAVAGHRFVGGPEEHVEVIVSGAQPYFHKTPWSPQPFSSPGKALGSIVASTEDGLDKAQLTFLHQMLAWQLAQFDVELADEITSLADKKRLNRIKGWEVKPSASMVEAVSIIVACRQKEPYTPMEAEAIVRRRVGKTAENPLHVYGFLFHVAFYPFTMLSAILAYVQMAIIVSRKIGIETKSTLETICLAFLAFLLGLPIAIIYVVIVAVPDIILLLVRPLLPLRIKLQLTQWFFPTSLAFWSCACLAPVAHLFLGACPLDDAFVNMSMGGELCNVQLERVPLSAAFQAAVVCSPHFLARHKNLRRIALRGVPEFFAPAGGRMAQMPLIVQWGYLLGDSELRAAWEAETAGCLPPNSHRKKFAEMTPQR